MKKVMLVLTVATLLSAIITPVSSVARVRGFPGPGFERSDVEFRQERRLNRLANVLELTDAQKASIETLNETFGEQIETLHESMKENREILKTLAEADPVDSSTIQHVADAQGDLFSDLVVLRTEKHTAFSAILTQQQLEKLEEFRTVIEDHRSIDNQAVSR